MINLYSNISYKQLYKQLLEIISKQSSLFSENWIVIPNQSAKQWLKNSIARDLGVCAQIKFIMPISFNWEIIQNVNISTQAVNVFNSDVLRWKIFEIIINDKEYAFLKSKSDLSNFNLAEKIAKIFLKYCDERPETIHSWDEGVFEIKKADEWQVNLWNKVLDELSEKSPVQLLHQLDVHKNFNKNPANIILFATEQLTTLQKNTILKLSETKEVHMLLSNPCPDFYWYDLRSMKAQKRDALFEEGEVNTIEDVNPILSILGRNKMAIFDAFIDENIIEQDSFKIEASPDTLLQSLKSDILQALDKPETFKVDDSISIYACHNRLREIEIIKDEILTNLDVNSDLTPEDIIIVAPDINEYVESIHQTFRYSQDNENISYLPYHIDRVRLSDENYIVSLMRLMKSFTQEMTANTVFDVLSEHIVLAKFSLSEDDLPRIKKWISDSNIRNFYSATQKAELGFERKEGNTWQFGEKRWLTGYVSGNVDDTDHLSTFGEFSGQEQLFSSVFGFLDLWFKTYKQFQQEQSPKIWFESIQDLCKSFLYNDKNDDYEAKLFKQLYKKLIQQPINNAEKIPLIVTNLILEDIITDDNFRSEGQIGVRFQSWKNSFIVDAKLLIVMGLNDGEFPQSELKSDLDIFNNILPRLNSSTRQRDKNLLLAALTENTQKIVMTYIGFNAKTNDTQPPSVLLAELISYLKQKTNDGFEVVKHKMHGFNSVYFNNKTNYHKSYNYNYFQLAKSFYQKSPRLAEKEISLKLEHQSKIYLHELIKYFIDPLDFFLKNRAAINNSIYADVLKDAETYQLDALEKWHLRNEVFSHGVGVAKKTGILTDNKSGQYLINDMEEAIDPLLKTQKSLNLSKKIIECRIDGSDIFGTIDIDDQDQLISIYPREANSKKIAEHWIKHLCYQSKKPSYIYFLDKVFICQALEGPEIYLAPIVGHWLSSYTKPWLFSPPSMLNPKGKFKRSTENAYYKSFDSEFSSQGQIYFKDAIQKYDFSIDIQIIVEPIIEFVEVCDD